MQKIDNILALHGIRKGQFQQSREFDSAAVYFLLQKLLIPLKEWPAYKLGVIDEKGQILVSRSKMTMQQEKAFTKFDLVALKIKQALEQTPRGGLISKMPPQTLASMLLKESEVPANIVGDGKIAQYEPLLRSRILKRKQLERKNKQDELVRSSK